MTTKTNTIDVTVGASLPVKCQFRAARRGEVYLTPYNPDTREGHTWKIARQDTDYPVIVSMDSNT